MRTHDNYEDPWRSHWEYCLVWVPWVVEIIQSNQNTKLLILIKKILSEEHKIMNLVETMVFYNSR